MMRLDPRVAIVVLAAALAGCSGSRTARIPRLGAALDEIIETARTAPSNSEIAASMKKGVRDIRAGDYEDAASSFAAGLRLDPTNGHMHFLNGLAYHLSSLSGDRSVLELAETGYALALRFDPSNHWAAYLLGHVYFEQKRYIDAQNQFSYGLLYSPDDPDLLRALAVASYYADSLDVGHWAAEKSVQLDPANPSGWRAALLTRAALGDDAGARRGLRRYRTLVSAPAAGRKKDWSALKWRIETASDRVEDWRKFHRQTPLLAQFSTTAQPEGGVLDLGDGDSDNYEPGEDESGPAPTGRSIVPAGMTGPGTPAAAAPSMSPAASETSSDAPPAAPTPSAAAAPADQADAQPVPAAPAKPVITLPRMTLVDVVILRSEEVRNQAKGVNLLAGLKATLSGVMFQYKHATGSGPGGASVRERSLSVAPLFNLAGLEYNMNVFNDGMNRAEVLARPSLLAIEGETSKFYSGATMHVQLNSNNTDGSMVDVPIGIHLDVTPTFLDEETVRITVHAERQFVETRDERLGYTAFSQNTDMTLDATAVLRFGQTLILSGLSENEDTMSKDGVPFLQSIPGLQYAFSRKETSQTKKSVLILLSPHRARYLDEDVSPGEAKKILRTREERKAHVEALRKQERILVTNSGVEAVIEEFKRKKFYREFRSGDLRLDEWQNNDSIFGGIKRAMSFLWY